MAAHQAHLQRLHQHTARLHAYTERLRSKH